VKLLVFGNPALAIDNLAVRVGKALQQEGFDVLHLEDPLGLSQLKFEEYLILDVAEGITEPRIITDLDKLVLGRLCSLHDFDMAYFLKLLKATGKIENVRILALPQQMALEDAVAAVKTVLDKI